MNSLLLQATTFSSLLASIDRFEPEDLRLSTGLNLCAALCRAGEWRTALEILESCVERSADSASRFEVALMVADCEIALEKYFVAEARLKALIDEVGSSSDPLRERLLWRAKWRLGYACWGLHRIDLAESHVSGAYEAFLAFPDSSDLGWCACTLGHIAWSRGELRLATTRYREAMVSADRTKTPELKATALKNLGLVLRQQCRWQQAAEAYSESAAIWSQLGSGAQSCHLHRAIAIARWKQGQLEAALAATTISRRTAEVLGNSVATSAASLLAGLIEIHSGDLAKGLQTLSEQARALSHTASSRLALLASEFLGDVHLEQGQAADALKHYDEVWPKAMALVPKGDIVAELRRRRAECYLLLGRHDEAYAAAAEALAHCRELGDRYEEAATYRVMALSAAAVGKADEARQHFIQGFAYYEDIETPYEWGKLWMAYGDWLSGPTAGPHSDRAGAREAYLAARDHFSNMGARAKLREAEARLATMEAMDPASAVASSTLPTAGATEFAESPPSIIRRARRRPTAKSALDLRSEAAWHDWYLVTRHEPFLDLLDRAAKLAKSEVSILITGETGTGKELIAAGMHRFSALSGPYVPLNCAAVPKEMIESELFGHVRGAFSGAVVERAGLVEMAAKGTLFLDEVGEMSEAMQAKMLRFLESGEYRRVGESTNRHVKTRLIAATNVARDALAKGDGMRGDLYWRLGQSFLDVPALRHRKGDVPLLLEHFLRLEASKMGKPDLTIGDDAMAQLEAHAWPGNIRELIGVMRRAVALADRTITPDHLDLASASEVAVTLTEELAATERAKLARAMRENKNSPTLAARALGIPRTTLVMKLKRLKLR